MRVRKVAKQLKRYHKSYVRWDKENDVPIHKYHLASHDDKVRYIMRMTRKHYFGLRDKYPVGSMMWKLYTHKACSYDLYDDIMSFWGYNMYE